MSNNLEILSLQTVGSDFYSTLKEITDIIVDTKFIGDGTPLFKHIPFYIPGTTDELDPSTIRVCTISYGNSSLGGIKLAAVQITDDCPIVNKSGFAIYYSSSGNLNMKFGPITSTSTTVAAGFAGNYEQRLTIGLLKDFNYGYGITTYNLNNTIKDYRIYRYCGSDVIFLAFGNILDKIAIFKMKHIDDPTNVKYVMFNTDRESGASWTYECLYDSKLNSYAYRYDSRQVHDNDNTGYTDSIYAYKYIYDGYYNDHLYYFDGGNKLPGSGVVRLGKDRFLKLGCTSLFIKME